MIHAVVVAYCSSAHIGNCLAPLLDDPFVSSVVVVDNSADPATEKICRNWADDGRLEYLPSANIGYAAACDRGVERAVGSPDYVAIINPDVALYRPLSELIKRVDSTSGSIFSARLQQPCASLNARQMATPAKELLNALVGSSVYSLKSVQSLSPRAAFAHVPQIDGSLLIVPAEEWRALGGLDQRFELYYEDVDFCRRANERSGCLIWLEPWGSHQAGASYAIGGEAPYIALRASRMRYLRKWYGTLGCVIGLVVAVLECASRAASGRAPSRRVIARALSAQLAEAIHPGKATHLM